MNCTPIHKSSADSCSAIQSNAFASASFFPFNNPGPTDKINSLLVIMFQDVNAAKSIWPNKSFLSKSVRHPVGPIPLRPANISLKWILGFSTMTERKNSLANIGTPAVSTFATIPWFFRIISNSEISELLVDGTITINCRCVEGRLLIKSRSFCNSRF